MTTQPFQPVGERPKWEIVYDTLEGLKVGDTITYEQMAQALGEPAWRDADRSAFYKAAARWGDEHHRSFRPVPNVGYRVIPAAEHEQVAKAHHRRSKRQIGKARTALKRADRTQLSAEDSQRFDRMETTLGRHADMIRRLEGRTSRVENAVTATQAAQSDTESRVHALEELLRKHGIGPTTPQNS